MLFVLLSAICSILLAHVLKSIETRQLATINVLTVSYLVATMVAIGINLWNGLSLIPDFPLWFWLFVVVIGVLFITNFFIFSKSVEANGVGVTLAAMRVSLFVPIIISVVIYGEEMNLSKISGISLVFVAMALFIMARRALKLEGVSNHILLLALFVMSGMADASMKIYEQEMMHIASEAHFLGVVFFVALCIGIAVSTYQGNLQKIQISEVKYGIFLGVPNLLTSIFLIFALSQLDASVVYALVNVLVIVGGTLLGVLFWKDRLTPKEWAGVFVAATAIVLLS